MTSSNRAVGQGGQPFSDFSLAVSVPQGRVRRAAVGLSVVGGESVHRFCVVIASPMQPQSNDKSRGLPILCSAAKLRKQMAFFWLCSCFECRKDKKKSNHSTRTRIPFAAVSITCATS